MPEYQCSQFIQPQVGEIWQLKMPFQGWYNGLVLEFLDETEKFVTAKIVTTELPPNYAGLNVEIHDIVHTHIPTPFVVYIDQAKNLTIDNFDCKRGQLSAEDSAEDLKRVLQRYKNLKGEGSQS